MIQFDFKCKLLVNGEGKRNIIEIGLILFIISGDIAV